MTEQDWNKKLVEKYPVILKHYGGNPRETCMAWGFECGEGWAKILDECMTRLQYIADLTGSQAIADQIKEKFGTLRFYYSIEGECLNDIDSDLIELVIGDAERKSRRTCEISGKPGALYKRGTWVKTLSPEIAQEMKYEPTNFN